MISRSNWFWTSLAASVLINAVLLFSSACYVYSLTAIHQDGYARGQVRLAADNDVALIFDPRITDTALGESTGTGHATDAVKDDKPLEAMLASQDQAFLSRDPEGPGKVGNEPSPSTQLPGENGGGDADQRQATFGVAAASPAQESPTFAQRSPSPLAPSRQEQPTKRKDA